MRIRRVLPVVLSLSFFATPLLAYQPGEVLLENRSQTASQSSRYDLWVYGTSPYAVLDSGKEVSRSASYTGSGHFLIPSVNRVVFHQDGGVFMRDNLARTSGVIAPGYRRVFTSDTELGEIAPMRASRYLVAERWAGTDGVASVIEFDLQGRGIEHPFPSFVDAETNRTLGAAHIELLADQCTLLYTVGADHADGNRVRRMDICTNQAKSDFATLTPGEYAGAIRQLPSGEVLVANGNAVLQFDAAGALIHSYYFPGVTRIALTPDGTSFWAAGVDQGRAIIRSFDPNAPNVARPPVQLGDSEGKPSGAALEATDLAVAGEWRAAVAQGARTRSRAARH